MLKLTFCKCKATNALISVLCFHFIYTSTLSVVVRRSCCLSRLITYRIKAITDIELKVTNIIKIKELKYTWWKMREKVYYERKRVNLGFTVDLDLQLYLRLMKGDSSFYFHIWGPMKYFYFVYKHQIEIVNFLVCFSVIYLIFNNVCGCVCPFVYFIHLVIVNYKR